MKGIFSSRRGKMIHRMRLAEVISWFSMFGYDQAANYFLGEAMDADNAVIPYCGEYWVNTEYVAKQIGKSLYKKMENDLYVWSSSIIK